MEARNATQQERINAQVNLGETTADAPSMVSEKVCTESRSPSTMAFRCLETPTPERYLDSASASAALTCGGGSSRQVHNTSQRDKAREHNQNDISAPEIRDSSAIFQKD